MTGHTPGPWSLTLSGRTIASCNVYTGKHIELTDVRCGRGSSAPYPSKEEMQANARLIAAAPELLAALEDVTSWLGGMAACRADDDYVNGLIAIIAKAKGE